jgi:hypothetical protein
LTNFELESQLSMSNTPFPQSYWVREGLLCAGHYPGSQDRDERDMKLTGLLDQGIRRIVNLIPAHETGASGAAFDPYEPVIQTLAASRGVSVECVRLGYGDGTTPERAHMSKILDLLDTSIAAGEPVYLHCWGGHGRTSSVVACYLIRHGQTPQAAIDQIVALRKPLPKNHFPFEGKQEAFVRSWRAGE